MGRTNATKTLKSNRKIRFLHTCHIKQKHSETQRFCGFSDAKGMKLGFTTFLSVYDDLLDSMCLWNPASAFSVPFYPTYGTQLTPMVRFLTAPDREKGAKANNLLKLNAAGYQNFAIERKTKIGYNMVLVEEIVC